MRIVGELLQTLDSVRRSLADAEHVRDIYRQGCADLKDRNRELREKLAETSRGRREAEERAADLERRLEAMTKRHRKATASLLLAIANRQELSEQQASADNVTRLTVKALRDRLAAQGKRHQAQFDWQAEELRRLRANAHDRDGELKRSLQERDVARQETAELNNTVLRYARLLGCANAGRDKARAERDEARRERNKARGERDEARRELKRAHALLALWSRQRG